MTYEFLIDSVWHPPLGFADAAVSALPGELELQALWFGGAFGRDFTTTMGKRVRIVQFGEWNRSAGPDFMRVVVEIDGQTKSGDLEIDLTPAAWEQHGHGNDRAFQQVVLHVVFEADARRAHTKTLDHREVPQVVIPGHLLDEALNRPLRETAIAHPGRCLAPLRQLGTAATEALLREAALRRARQKALRWMHAEDAHGREAALYFSLAETLGYRGNSLAMRLLGQRLPLAELRAAPAQADALLFGTAGFLSPKLHEQAPEETQAYLRTLWDTWWRSRARFETPGHRAIPWKTGGQRPANHPHRRLGGLSAAVGEWGAFRKLALAEPFAAKPVVDFLQGLQHPFWGLHHTLTSSAAPRRIAVVGRSQALELIANHLAPLALHEERMDWKSYWKIRTSTPNDRVRRCAIRLFGSEKQAAPWLKRLCHHQALLQVYQDFCLEDTSACRECPFPEQLLQWKP